MTRSHLLVAVVISIAAGCSDSEPSQLRYTGTIHVTERFAASGTISGSVFGRITIPSALVPTATVGDCDYFANRLPAGIGKGTLTVESTGEPMRIDPQSFVDGSLYMATLPHVPFSGPSIGVTLADASGLVSVDAFVPTKLEAVDIPKHISQASDATIRWAAGRSDEIEIELQYTSLGRSQTIRCTTFDEGHFTIPAEVLALVERSAIQELSPLLVTRRRLEQTVSEAADLELNLAVESQVFDSVQLEP